MDGARTEDVGVSNRKFTLLWISPCVYDPLASFIMDIAFVESLICVGGNKIPSVSILCSLTSSEVWGSKNLNETRANEVKLGQNLSDGSTIKFKCPCAWFKYVLILFVSTPYMVSVK